MRVSTEEITAYAACPHALCEQDPGHRQVRVPAIRETVVRTFGDSATSSDPYDIAVKDIESTSHVYLRFSDPADSVCPCGREKGLSEQERPIYPSITQQLVRARKAADAASDVLSGDDNADRLLEAQAAAKRATQQGPVEREPKPKGVTEPAAEAA